MKKKLLIVAAVAFAIFAIPCGSNALSTVAVASENNTIATPEPVTKPVDEVKNAVSEIKPEEITTSNDVDNATLKLADIGSTNLKNALNSDPNTIADIARIEEACLKVDPNRKTKLVNSSASEIEAVGVIGASFASDDTILEVAPPSEEPHIDVAAYDVTSEPVYVEISLKVYGAYERNYLPIPVAVTIKRPANVDGNKAVIFHYLYGTFEAIKPYYNAEDDTLTFAVDHFSTFAIAEAENTTAAATAGSGSEFERYRDNLTNEIANAKDGATIKISRDENINALPNDIMKALYKKQTVALELEYTFEGKEYTVTIPAGKAEDNDIEWYGPLYLQMRYGK